MGTIAWGMIGCGDVTEVKSGPALSKVTGSKLVAVMSRDGRRAADYARRHGVPRHHDDASAIIDDPAIDAVYIATPPSSHAAYTIACARSGKPVYVEKPMAHTFEDAQRMLRACEQAEVPLWVAYYRRALPRMLAVRSLIEEGAVGDVRLVRSFRHEMLSEDYAQTWRTDPSTCGGGMFFDGVCHIFDFLDFLFGPVLSVSGLARNAGSAYAAEDTVTASYAFESGVLGAGTWCFSAGSQGQRDEIIGSEGRLVWSIANPGPIRLHRGGETTELDIVDPEHVHQPLVQSIVDELAGRGRCPSTGESALRTARVMEEILRGGSPV